jgi:type II secretory pathway pseudopilin PulG
MLVRYLRQRRVREETRQRSERGDTLIEVLVGITIISIGVLAILGSLITSTSASVTHRSLAGLDSILRSFAESARYQIQTQPADGSAGPLFRPCATSYPLVSDPYPNSAMPGSWITVFVTGFTPNSNLSVSIQGYPGTITVDSGGTTDQNGNATLVFTAPNATGAVTVSDQAGDSATPKVPFTAAASGPVVATSPYINYTLTSTVAPYGGGTCPLNPQSPAPSQQQITLMLSDPQSGNGAEDQLPFVVGNFDPAPVTVAVNYSSQTVPSTITFQAAVTNSSGSPVTSGTVTWQYLSAPSGSSPTCQNLTGMVSTLSPGNPATCVMNVSSYSNYGNYSVSATYHAASGSYPDGYFGQTTAILGRALPTLTVTQTATSGPIDLAATVTGSGPVPNGSVAFTLAGSDGSSWTCPAQPGSLNGNTLSFRCVSNLNNPVTGVIYTATANYTGDTTYANGLAQTALTDPLVTVAGSSASNHKLTFTATVAGSRTDNATVTSGSATVSDTSITAADTGNPVVGPGIPNGTYVGTVTPGVSFLLSSSATSQVPAAGVPATANGTSVIVSEGANPVPTGTVKWTLSDFRTDTATVTSGSPTVSDPSITAADLGNPVAGAGIPAGSYVGTVTPGVSFLLSSSATSQVPAAGVPATANGTSVVFSDGTPPTCANSTLNSSGVTPPCTFTGPSQGGNKFTYTATAQYQGDTNYLYDTGVSAQVIGQ